MRQHIAAALFSLMLTASVVHAVDGVIEINAARAAVGGVTAADTPGYPVTVDAAGSYRLTGNLATGSKNLTAILITANDVRVDLNGFTIACTFSLGPVLPRNCATAGGGSGVAVDNPEIRRHTVVTNGTIRTMGDDGVRVGAESFVTRVRAINNDGRGILAGANSILRGNVASGNEGIGLGGGDASIVTDNIVRENNSIGISVLDDCSVTGNTVRNNMIFGITSGTGSTLVGNAVRDNGNIGIIASSGSTVIGNSVQSNLGVGLSLAGTAGFKDNALEGNNSNAFQVTGGVSMGVNVCSPIPCP
jgi:parallel beta-helix repeat protein